MQQRIRGEVTEAGKSRFHDLGESRSVPKPAFPSNLIARPTRSQRTNGHSGRGTGKLLVISEPCCFLVANQGKVYRDLGCDPMKM